ncbi:DUF4097 family beta strand repeat protein [Pontibacter sp. FD36]|uniref:DUF4097 family beta strand repeat-containing protein n=1 Tax=Pontibacter sp. FD36 TaxID=2789860 RepID=UPI0018A9081F|nr:DUF4097 family beta strand repeat-containing protein [Pontibacter sp. FD36]MBF8965011.1 DUF4097 family beta strand repeat protein [Pontibacter sp. FD36]
MKRNMIIMLFLMLSTSLFAQETQELKVPLSKPNEIGTLEVNLVFGSIKVSGTKTKEVVVLAKSGTTQSRIRENIVVNVGADGPDSEAEKKQARKAGQSAAETSGLKRIPNTNMSLTVTEQNNNVQISTESINRPLHLEIMVPANFNLKLSTVNNGNITISNVNGNLELSNVNGSIVLENVSGTAMANTTNGAVKANILKWDGKSPMAFSTLNGNVDVTLPANSKFNTKLKSDRGEVYTDFEMTRDATQKPTGTRSEKGLYRVSTADFITGKVNGGGPEIMIKNMNGNIYLRKASK